VVGTVLEVVLVALWLEGRKEKTYREQVEIGKKQKNTVIIHTLDLIADYVTILNQGNLVCVK
jgi:Tat protein secretion system quality control protein TatD with DNase activity